MSNLPKNNEQFSTENVDLSTQVEENSPNESKNQGANTHNSSEIIEEVSKSTENTSKSSESPSISSENANSISENAEKTSESVDFSSFESQIQRDFNEFQVVYPNISKSSLLSDECFRIFSEGKEKSSLLANYAKYLKLTSKIESQAICKAQARQNNADSSVGGLSSTKNGDEIYFTREQVLRMSQEEIKRNFKRIRESQARW